MGLGALIGISAFQFHKVRLKLNKNYVSLRASLFQFHKVRLKPSFSFLLYLENKVITECKYTIITKKNVDV